MDTSKNPVGGILEDSELDGELPARKSPAALFGSQGIGAVILPAELQESIDTLISESDKSQLHSDAKRLFQSEVVQENTEHEWSASYDVKYRSRQQAARHYQRDGTAFASVALPAHYTAIYSVLSHVKRRLEASWNVRHVVDWGAGTGSGLWAASYAFQQSASETKMEDLELKKSSLLTYQAIEKRDGLALVGKKLLKDVDKGGLEISWNRAMQDLALPEGENILALSAFLLATLPTAISRKQLVKRMWESGAHVIVLVDHNTPAGFEAIAEAREFLLRMGRKEVAELKEGKIKAHNAAACGSHVVAPCPHDSACPLLQPGSTKVVCGFDQRLQRPAFVRRTKHSGIGHEDVEYSYIVIRRGPRPTAVPTSLGRIGEVGRRVLDQENQDLKQNTSIKELQIHNDYDLIPIPGETDPVDDLASTSSPARLLGQAELNEALRREAFSWPRLVFPPLKRNGHIIMDSCTAEGKIMRMTIPRSQGRQPFYDARKSAWGDLFPHPPKNPPQERQSFSKKVQKQATGFEIGKRRNTNRKKEPIMYEGLSSTKPEKKSRQAKS